MKPRYSFSSRHNRRTGNIKKQKQKYPFITEKIIENSDIILEVLDSRFIDETRNEEYEEKIKKRGKKIIYVFNKSDLVFKKQKEGLFPSIFVSCVQRKGISELRNLIKKESRKIKKSIGKDGSERIIVGVIGYPNTGKSSLINLLIGRSSAGTSPQAGYTKSLQKLRLTENIHLLDSPGVIPEREYSTTDREKIAMHAKLGARDYSKVKDPEMVVAELFNQYRNILEKHYNLASIGDAETLIEKIGRKKGFLKKGGLVDEDKTSRFILRDWQAGKIRL